MVKIIFSRIGKKKAPIYRIIALDKQKDPWGKNLEILGQHNPATKETTLKEDRVKYWLEKGAQPSDTVHNLLVEKEIIKDKKRSVSKISDKRKKKLAQKEKEAKKAAAKPAKSEAATEPAPDKPEEEKNQEKSPKAEQKPKPEKPAEKEQPAPEKPAGEEAK